MPRRVPFAGVGQCLRRPEKTTRGNIPGGISPCRYCHAVATMRIAVGCAYFLLSIGICCSEVPNCEKYDPIVSYCKYSLIINKTEKNMRKFFHICAVWY